jgi:hypothetical protein
MTDDEVRALAAAAGLTLDDERIARVRPIVERALAGVDELRELPLDEVAPEPGRTVSTSPDLPTPPDAAS